MRKVARQLPSREGSGKAPLEGSWPRSGLRGVWEVSKEGAPLPGRGAPFIALPRYPAGWSKLVSQVLGPRTGKYAGFHINSYVCSSPYGNA